MKLALFAPQKIRERIFGGGNTLLTADITPVEAVLDHSESKKTSEYIKPSNDPIRGNKGKRKICVALCAAMIFSLALAGCGSKVDPEKEQQQADYAAQTAIKQQLEDTPLPKGYGTLLDDGDFFTVLCSNGEATVTVKAFMPYTIPYVAEIFLPAAQTAAEDAGVSLARFDVSSYNTNKDGMVDGTFATWTCEDGETGNLATDVGGSNTVKQGLTIAELYDYYADYKPIVQNMVEEAGGTLE